MTEAELKAIIEHEIDHAIDSELDSNCDRALDYYLGEAPAGNDIENRSQVVSRDLADTVEWLLPDIIRTFMSSDDFVRFEPEGPEDVEQAEQESDFCNYVFDKDNNGYLLMYSWVKDALLFKNGYVKAWWEEKTEQKQESYEGMTDDEFTMFMMEYPEELKEHTVEERAMPVQTGQGMYMIPTLVHDFKCEKKTKTGKVRIEPVPRNEIYVSRKTRTVNVSNAQFVAHIRKRPMSELIEEGHDKAKLDKIGGGSLGRGTEQHRMERFVINYEDDEWTESADKSRRELWVAECYILVDHDGDGRSEMRKVTLAGDTIIENESADRNPFHCISPIIMPHNHQGRSMYDLSSDIQDIRTQLWRQSLDNLYFANNQRTVINDGNVNLEDLLTVRPQGIIRTSGVPANDVMPFPVQSISSDTFPMLGMLDDVGRQRTGVDPGMGNLDPNVLKNVNTAPFMEVSQARKGRVELIIRTFAETGIKSLFLHIHELLQKHQKQARMIKLRENYVPVSPTEWKDRNNMTVNVGLGTGNKQEKLMNMELIVAAQEKLVEFGLVGPKEATSSFEEIASNAGYKDWQRFCKPADQATPPADKGDPTTELMKMQLEIERERNQINAQKMQLDAQKMQMEHQQKTFEFERKVFETQSKQNVDAGNLERDAREGQQLHQREIEKIAQGWEKIQNDLATKIAELGQRDMQARESSKGMNNNESV